MIDWTSVIIAMLTGGTLAGAATSVMFWRENKRIKKSEAKHSEASAMKEDISAGKEALELLNRTMEQMEKINGYNEKATIALLDTLSEKEDMIENLRREVKELRVKTAENERKLRGLENALNDERNARKELEQHKCIVDGCSLRQPPLKNSAS